MKVTEDEFYDPIKKNAKNKKVKTEEKNQEQEKN